MRVKVANIRVDMVNDKEPGYAKFVTLWLCQECANAYDCARAMNIDAR
jgi:hypothetical protein